MYIKCIKIGLYTEQAIEKRLFFGIIIVGVLFFSLVVFWHKVHLLQIIAMYKKGGHTII